MDAATSSGEIAPQTALVTGATGFVGGPTVRALAAAGFSVRALVRDPSRLGTLRERVADVVQGDLEDAAVLRRAAEGCDLVVHIAGLTRARFVRDFDRVNLDGTRRLAEAARGAERPPKRFVLISSLAAAGPSAPGVPRVEADPCAPVSRYGRSKLAGERAAAEVLEGSSMRLVVVRPPIVYGEGDRDVLLIFRQVLKGVIPVVGGEASLTKVLSLVHVDDLADAIVAACAREAAAGRTYFTPGPRDASFLEMLTAIEAAVGRRARRVSVPSMLAAAGAVAIQSWSALVGKPSLVNLDKLREAAATGWACTGAAAARDLGFAPRVDYVEGFARQAQFARAKGLL